MAEDQVGLHWANTILLEQAQATPKAGASRTHSKELSSHGAEGFGVRVACSRFSKSPKGCPPGFSEILGAVTIVIEGLKESLVPHT